MLLVWIDCAYQTLLNLSTKLVVFTCKIVIYILYISVCCTTPKELTTFYIRCRRSALANTNVRDCNRTLPQTKHEDLIERNTPPLCKPESLLVCVHPRRRTVKIYRPAKLPKVHLASSAYVVVFASCLGHGHCHHTPSNSHRFEHVYHASPSKVVQDLGISVMYQ